MGTTIVKKDGGRFGLGDDSTLEGAQFVLAKSMPRPRSLRLGESKSDSLAYLMISEDGTYSWTRDKSLAHVFTTGSDGKVEVAGLASGDYKFEEIKAPTGYNLPEGDAAFTDFRLDENTSGGELAIENTRSADMPLTGSEKLVIVGGCGLLLAGIAYAVSKKRKNEETK